MAAGRGQLAEKFFGKRRALAGLERLDVGHPLVGRVDNHVRVGLEQRDAQQAIMVGRLLRKRNAQPLVIRIEAFGHGTLACFVAPSSAVRPTVATAEPDNPP